MPQKVAPSPLRKHIKGSPQVQALRHARGKSRRRLSVLVSILVIVALTSLIILARNERFAIRAITVSGNEIISTTDIQQIVEKELSGSYAYVLPKRAFFLYPRKKITQSIWSAFPRFDSIEVKRDGKRALTITVTEQVGQVLWCGESIGIFHENNKCYFADNTGKIIDTAPSFSGDVYLRFVGGTVDIGKEIIGQPITDTDTFNKLVVFAKDMSTLDFSVHVIFITPNGDDVMLVTTGQGRTADILFRQTDDLDVIVNNLSTALGKDTLAEKMKTSLAELEYFDLRFSNKVYYKFLND